MNVPTGRLQGVLCQAKHSPGTDVQHTIAHNARVATSGKASVQKVSCTQASFTEPQKVDSKEIKKKKLCRGKGQRTASCKGERGEEPNQQAVESTLLTTAFA